MRYIFNGRMIEAKMKPVEPRYTTSCLICGEDVPVWVLEDSPKICEKCKAAVMHMRKLVFGYGTDSGDKKD